MDSGASGDMNDGLIWNMTRFWLTKKVNGNLYNELNAQLRNQQNHGKDFVKKKLEKKHWKKSTELHPPIGNKCCTRRIIKWSIDAFKAMFSANDLVLHVINQTNLFAVQHGKGNLNIFEDEIKTFIPILLLSAYCKVPYRYLYWIATPDTHNEPVSSSRTRNRFWEILSSLHPVDNI